MPGKVRKNSFCKRKGVNWGGNRGNKKQGKHIHTPLLFAVFFSSVITTLSLSLLPLFLKHHTPPPKEISIYAKMLFLPHWDPPTKGNPGQGKWGNSLNVEINDKSCIAYPIYLAWLGSTHQQCLMLIGKFSREVDLKARKVKKEITKKV